MKNLLKSWTLYESDLTGHLSIIGYIYNDEQNRFENGEPIRTSSIQYLDLKNKTAKTLNTLYNLE